MDRRNVLDALVPYFASDSKMLLLACDMGFGAIDAIKQAYPDRVINMGIMEQATIGTAAGLAISGMRPIVYSIVNFLAFRCLEQIRLNVVKQQLNVKLIGMGADNYFRHLGYSHTCDNDDVEIMNVIGMPVYDLKRLPNINHWIERQGPAYLRV